MPQQATLEESYLALVEFLMLAKHRMIEVGSKHDLSAMQAVSLLLLSEPRPMHYFTKIFNCDPSNVTGIVDGLEEKGLATRTGDPNDRRIKMISLLPAGKKIRSALVSQQTGDDHYLLSRLSEQEAQTFIDIVQKITKT